MKLEIHKDYELNDGSRMTVFRKDADEDFVGIIHQNSSVWYWKENGDVVERQCIYSVRREWVEPKTMEVEFWVNVYHYGAGSSWLTEEDAINLANNTIFARINIKRTVTEGEGLTEEELKRRKAP